jgi:hypothetical protein
MPYEEVSEVFETCRGTPNGLRLSQSLRDPNQGEAACTYANGVQLRRVGEGQTEKVTSFDRSHDWSRQQCRPFFVQTLPQHAVSSDELFPAPPPTLELVKPFRAEGSRWNGVR